MLSMKESFRNEHDPKLCVSVNSTLLPNASGFNRTNKPLLLHSAVAKHVSLQLTHSISNYSFDNGRMKICVKWLIKREGPKT